MRSWFRVGLRVGLLGGAIFAVVVTLRSRRTDQIGSGNGSVGVHGDWPEVRRSPNGAAGDHHPHGRVTVPLEAAPLGAPPAVQTAQPGRDEPEVPEPSEHLDEEETPAPAQSGAPGAPAAAPSPPADKPAAPVAKAVKKAAKKAAAPAKKDAAPVKKAAAKAKAPAKKARARADASAGTAAEAGTGAEAPAEPSPPAPWVAPEGAACPASHPVKAKLSSRLFHLPGMFAYNRTVPDRCYLDASAAEADGLTRAKR